MEEVPHSMLRPKRKAAATAEANVKRTALESSRRPAGLDAKVSYTGYVPPQAPALAPDSPSSPLSSLHTTPSPPVTNVRQQQQRQGGGQNASQPPLLKQIVQAKIAEKQKNEAGSSIGGKGKREGKGGKGGVQAPKLKLVIVNHKGASEELVSREATQRSSSSQEGDTLNSGMSIRRSSRDRRAAVPRGETPTPREAAQRVWVGQPPSRSQTPVPPPPQRQGQPQPRGRNQAQAAASQPQRQGQPRHPPLGSRRPLERQGQSQPRGRVQSQAPAPQAQGQPQPRRQSQIQIPTSQRRGQPDPQKQNQAQTQGRQGQNLAANNFRTRRGYLPPPNALDVQAANSAAAIQTQARSNVQSPSPRIYDQIAHLQHINRNATDPNYAGIQHLIQRAIDPPPAVAAAGYGQNNNNHSQLRGVQGNPLRGQVPPNKLKNPERAALGLLQKSQSELIRIDDPDLDLELHLTTVAVDILNSMRGAFAAAAQPPAEIPLPHRQPPTPNLCNLAIGQLRRAREELDPPLFGKDNLNVPRPISQEDSLGCTFCLFSCDIGVSDSRIWLPIEAAPGFCFNCERAPMSFYDEWTIDPSNFQREAVMKGKGYIQELDGLSNIPPLGEFAKEQDFVGVSENITGRRVFGGKEERAGRIRDKVATDVPRVISELDKARDVTRFQGIMFCRGCPWRQVDTRRARICDDCRQEKMSILKHRHTEFSLILEDGDVVDAWGEDARQEPRERFCMICPANAMFTCDGCPLKVCGDCRTLLMPLCKGHLNFLFYHYHRTHLRNDAFLLRSDGGGF